SSLIIEGNKRVVFSVDLCRQDDYLMPAPPPCPASNVVIMESTYGARQRKGAMEEDMLNFLKKVKDEKMVGIIASFALARGQVLLTMIEELFRQQPELRVPLVYDSPMMKEVNQVYRRQQKLTKRPLELERALTEAESLDYIGQWETISRKNGPLIIVSSS